MASPLQSLLGNESSYTKSFQIFLDYSTEHQCMHEFIDTILQDHLTSIGNDKSELNVLGIGSGKGQIDLHILSYLKLKHPGVSINNEVVDPNVEHLKSYRELVAKTPHLENISFTWNTMTASDFKDKLDKETEARKFDFIHMIQMLYYVEDPGEVIKYFHGLLAQNGKLLIIIVSGNSGWERLWIKYKSQLCYMNATFYVTANDVMKTLDTFGLKYQHFEFPSTFNITECFTANNEIGDLILDFLTETVNFRATAPPDLRDDVLALLRHPDCSLEKDGKFLFNNTLTAIIVES
ncbi:histamine N-methyltransferase isoform X1 [Erpetoichthys calabaricus]|uniref:histamine N-methyltransferase isoform X1 n=1 Tax=Erpetoichthys calabaricus TaxID=27687 RepID=UPI0010A04912|nr:histamine N-methyltransferase isoform X1 [Erpetoichthys calabaricus]